MGRSFGIRHGLVTLALALAALAPPGGATTHAADVSCGAAPRIAAPVPPVEAEASPAADRPGATPVAADEAEAAAESPGPDFAAGIETLVETVAACQSDGDAERLVALVTPGYLGDAFAGGGRLPAEAYLALAPSLPRARLGIREVANVRVAPSGNATADVTAVHARQLVVDRWRFVPDEAKAGRWLVDGITPRRVPAPKGADTAAITLRDGRYAPSKLRVEGPDVVLAAENAGKADHELLVLQITDDDVAVADLLSAATPGLPAGVRFVAQQTVLAGGSADLVLVTLKPGDYLIVDLLPTAEGIPNLSLGMQADLVVS